MLAPTAPEIIRLVTNCCDSRYLLQTVAISLMPEIPWLHPGANLHTPWFHKASIAITARSVKMIKLIGSSLALTALLFAGQAFAGDSGVFPYGHAATVRHHHDHCIERGIRSGELTGREVRGLKQDRNALHRLAHAYRADGVLTHAERSNLRREHREFSREVYEQMHDRQHRH
jgi:hypothetical protein